MMHFEELWTAPTLGAAVLRTLLTPVSWLYAAGWQAYLATYRLGLKQPSEPHSPVLCIGNLQVGGTGKTPFTIYTADVLRELGYDVVVSCSGYGSPASESARIAPAGPLNASEWGDEAALFRLLRPSLTLIVGRRRVFAAELCHRDFPNAVLLMDDGFQHLPLKKHLTIVLDPEIPNHRCLPAGPYREPRSNKSRADLSIPGRFSVETEPMVFRNPEGSTTKLHGEVNVLCALGQPNRFVDRLRLAGLTVKQADLRPDHDPLAEGNLLAQFDSRLPLVVTGKDWVKLRERSDIATLKVAIAGYEVRAEPEEEFRAWLQAKLDGYPKKAV